MGGGQILQSKLRAMPGQTGPAGLEGLVAGHARPADQGSLKPGLLCFLCFLICLLLLVPALAGVTIGTTASAVAHIARIKSRIANLPMRPS